MRTQSQDDETYELAFGAWRQFMALRLDLPAPTQPEIDARLLRYRRALQATALAEFGAALVLAAGMARALAATTPLVGRVDTGTEVLILLLTALLLAALATRSLKRARSALEQRTLAQRVDIETLDRRRIDSLFADVRAADVRSYVHEVLLQGRGLRRAEAALALDRGRGVQGPEDASRAAFERAVRRRQGAQPREIAIAAACLVAGLALGRPGLDGATLLPGLYLLGAGVLADLPHTVLQLAVDPWYLTTGGRACRRLRAGLVADLIPQVAVFLAVVLTAAVVGSG